jgi:hypothetical protein
LSFSQQLFNVTTPTSVKSRLQTEDPPPQLEDVLRHDRGRRPQAPLLRRGHHPETGGPGDWGPQSGHTHGTLPKGTGVFGGFVRRLHTADRRQGQGRPLRGRPHLRRHPQEQEDPRMEDLPDSARTGARVARLDRQVPDLRRAPNPRHQTRRNVQVSARQTSTVVRTAD